MEYNWARKKMRKKLWITMLSAFTLSCVLVLVVAACNKDSDDDDEGGGNSSISAPTGVFAEESDSKVYVYWNEVPEVNYYNVYRSERSNGSYSFYDNAYSNSYCDEDPMSDNYYKITAIDCYGDESAKSSYAYCNVENGGGGNGGGGGGGGGGGVPSAPDAPTGLEAYNVGSTAVPNIKISWNSVSDASSYLIYRSKSANSGYSKIGESYWNDYNDYYPNNGKNYYKVKAVNSAGTSSYSEYVLFDFDANGYEPCPPNTLTGSATSTGSSSARITLRWTFSTTGGCGTPTKIHVRVMDPDSNSGIEVDNSPFSGSATSCTFTIDYLTAWNMGSGWIMMGVAGENDHGTSNYKTISYNYLTNEWI